MSLNANGLFYPLKISAIQGMVHAFNMLSVRRRILGRFHLGLPAHRQTTTCMKTLDDLPMGLFANGGYRPEYCS
jgi:hypothetical protein